MRKGLLKGSHFMRVLVLAGVALMTVIPQSSSADELAFEHSLKRLAPPERLEQLCDYTAMTRIREQDRSLRPDRAVAAAAKEPRMTEHTIVADGAAFRSRGKWYTLSFRCTADTEHLKVLSFKFKTGDEIPEAKWTAYNLWD
jgi:hypothetical protein